MSKAAAIHAIKSIYSVILPNKLETNISNDHWHQIMGHLENLPSQPDVMVQDLLATFPKHFDIESKLGDIKANTIIIGGLEDDIAEVKYQKVLNKAIPNLTLKIYRANHFIVNKAQNGGLHCAGYEEKIQGVVRLSA